MDVDHKQTNAIQYKIIAPAPTIPTFNLKFDVIIKSSTLSSSTLINNATRQQQIVNIARAAFKHVALALYNTNIDDDGEYTFTFDGVTNNDNSDDDSMSSQFDYDITVTFDAETQVEIFLFLFFVFCFCISLHKKQV